LVARCAISVQLHDLLAASLKSLRDGNDAGNKTRMARDLIAAATKSQASVNASASGSLATSPTTVLELDAVTSVTNVNEIRNVISCVRNVAGNLGQSQVAELDTRRVKW
jgi:hypothetical protein